MTVSDTGHGKRRVTSLWEQLQRSSSNSTPLLGIQSRPIARAYSVESQRGSGLHIVVHTMAGKLRQRTVLHDMLSAAQLVRNMPCFMDREFPSPCFFHIITEPISDTIKSTTSKPILMPVLIFSPTRV